MRIDLKTEGDEVLVEGERDELIGFASTLLEAALHGSGEGEMIEGEGVTPVRAVRLEPADEASADDPPG